MVSIFDDREDYSFLTVGNLLLIALLQALLDRSRWNRRLLASLGLYFVSTGVWLFLFKDVFAKYWNVCQLLFLLFNVIASSNCLRMWRLLRWFRTFLLFDLLSLGRWRSAPTVGTRWWSFLLELERIGCFHSWTIEFPTVKSCCRLTFPWQYNLFRYSLSWIRVIWIYVSSIWLRSFPIQRHLCQPMSYHCLQRRFSLLNFLHFHHRIILNCVDIRGVDAQVWFRYSLTRFASCLDVFPTLRWVWWFLSGVWLVFTWVRATFAFFSALLSLQKRGIWQCEWFTIVFLFEFAY